MFNGYSTWNPTGCSTKPQHMFKKKPTQNVLSKHPTCTGRSTTMCSTNNQQVFNKHPLSVQQTSKKCSTNIQEMFNKHPTSIQQITLEQITVQQVYLALVSFIFFFLTPRVIMTSQTGSGVQRMFYIRLQRVQQGASVQSMFIKNTKYI